MISIRRILCPIDFSDASLRALDHAIALARWYESSLTALLVEIAVPTVDGSPFDGFASGGSAVAGGARRAQLLGQMRAFASRAHGGAAVDLEVEETSDVRRAIVDRARVMPADLIVMGSHGRSGLKKVLLGSVAERVLREAPCPVMVVPPHDVVPPSTVSFKHLVCAVDFSENSLGALTWALSLAEEADARLSLLHVQELPPELREPAVASDENLDELHAAARAETLARLRSLVPEGITSYCSVETAAVAGAAGREILKFASDRHADLIVMGARGHSAVERFVFGSKTQDVVRGANCPVLTVR